MIIDGPAGPLEAIVENAAATPSDRVAVLCHPHPLYGGSMYDGVLDRVSQALRAHGVDCVRFNFRGVGNSAGRHADGIGEQDDLRAVVARVQADRPGATPWLAGYSFGSWVARHAAPGIAGLARLLLVAPPHPRMDFAGVPPACPVHVFIGTADAFADLPALEAWCRDLPAGSTLDRIDGGDHFFGATGRQLGVAIGARIAG